MKLKALVFDLDGTILDTLGDLRDSVNFALASNSLPIRTTEEIRSFVGNGIRLLIERAVPEGTPADVTDKCFSDFKSYYKIHSAILTKPYEGVNELLTEVKNMGYKLAVVSNKADFAVQELVKRYFGGKFDYSVGERSGIRRKPDPDSVLYALEKLGISRDEAIYIGDSDVDIETARNCGMKCISVLWGFRDKDFLQQFNPDYFVNTPNEIARLIAYNL